MGCSRFIWNAKCDEHRYYSTYAGKYFPIGTYAPVDTKAAHFKSKELSSWLYSCPSQIIRNSATNWYQTYQKHMKGLCGKPKRKVKSGKAKQKAGLNKAILNVGWHTLEIYTRYKADKSGKAIFKIAAPYTNQECANCSHTQPDNRKTPDVFSCGNCGHVDNADRNASIVIKKQAINLFSDSGTELVGKGIPVLTKGRGAVRKSRKTKVSLAVGNETSKKKRTVTTAVAA